jgi:polyphosphate kinase
VDPEIIEELYAASQAGVKIDLLVRGICCLRPGVPGISENIRIVSLVGRFLEHSRIYWFDNGGNPEVFIGSADIMRRNLERRIEALVPIDSKELQIYIREQILDTYLRDNTNSWLLKSDGTYTRITAGKLPQFSAQNALMSSRTKSNARFARPNSS